MGDPPAPVTLTSAEIAPVVSAVVRDGLPDELSASVSILTRLFSPPAAVSRDDHSAAESASVSVVAHVDEARNESSRINEAADVIVRSFALVDVIVLSVLPISIFLPDPPTSRPVTKSLSTAFDVK